LPPEERKACGFRSQTALLLPPHLGWKAEPSSRVGGGSRGGSPRKGEALPHIRRQSRFGMLRFGDFDATLCAVPLRLTSLSITRRLQICPHNWSRLRKLCHSEAFSSHSRWLWH